MIKAAIEQADARGMTLVPSPTNPALARIRCRACGWPHTPQEIYDVLVERYLLAPHGCHPCTWTEAHGVGPVPMLSNGYPRPEGQR